MNTPNDSDGGKRIRSLDQLAQDIPPPRDLWPGIAAEIAKDAKGAGGRSRDDDANPLSRSQWAALAAVVAALAVGVWLGRNVIPGGSQSVPAIGGTQEVVAASY